MLGMCLSGFGRVGPKAEGGEIVPEAYSRMPLCARAEDEAGGLVSLCV